ncbi:MAG: hypothetical protein EOM20_15310 [Spartobacteria bacterium]|nr:hypothetical protein [Spartobacteria bacterium]
MYVGIGLLLLLLVGGASAGTAPRLVLARIFLVGNPAEDACYLLAYPLAPEASRLALLEQVIRRVAERIQCTKHQ